MQLSVVTSVFRTAQFLHDYVARTDLAARQCGFSDYEMIVVVDGSPDDAVSVLRGLKHRYPALRVFELSRNFGHHPALWCGLTAARGELVFLTDSDLETGPEILTELFSALADPQVDMAFACQAARPEPPLRRWASQVFWQTFNSLAGTAMPAGMLTERLMRRRYRDALLQLNERALFLAGMMEWIGFRQVAVPAVRTPRAGRPSYTLLHRLHLSFQAITSFSVVPIALLFVAGTALAGVAMLAGLVLIVLKLIDPTTIVAGFTALAVLMLFSLGAVLGAIGIVGLYLGQVFLQTKGRPLYVVREEF